MIRRRRRFLREETIAPWLTIAVVVVIWWAGASDSAELRTSFQVRGVQEVRAVHRACGAEVANG